MEQLHYNLLYRWFVASASTSRYGCRRCSRSRERLLEAEVAHRFLAELMNHKEVRGLLPDDHLSVELRRLGLGLLGNKRSITMLNLDNFVGLLPVR
jgi:hypothetical protein